MKLRWLIAFGFLFTALSAAAQAPRELLQSVESTYADRLAAYNSVFLQEVTYSAARYRIVKPNAELLISEEDIWVTPFDDVDPIRIEADGVRRGPDFVVWSARVERENFMPLPPGIDPIAEQYSSKWNQAELSMYRWDLDESGVALLSMMNRFEFSPNWIFDDADHLVWKPGNSGVQPERSAGAPQTPDQIARHRRLLALEKHAFGSVTADFRSPDGVHYSVVPLKFTPQYSVVLEEDPDLTVPIQIDGDVSTLTPEQQRRGQQYVEFLERLPKEAARAARRDLK